MTTHPVYDQLLSEVTDDLERQVLQVLIERAGTKTSRPDMVFAVFGIYVQASQLADSTEDRKIRECIERLRATWPIVSSSGEAGYILEDNEASILEFAKEQESRADKNRRNARLAYGWIPKARSIKEARRTAEITTQPSLL
jgi:hypothetical protein